MSARGRRLLLCCYPRAWRERYGEELDELLEATSGHGRVDARAAADVVRAGLVERLREWGIGEGVPAYERARGGVLLVLVAWAAFLVAGARVQKFAEHWRAFTPLPVRGLPDGAFHVLVVAAAFGAACALLGVALALPAVLADLRAGGWRAVRRPLLRAIAVSAPTLAMFVAIAIWAHQLDGAERNGASVAYAAAIVVFALLAIASLAAWATAAVSIARRARLGVELLRVEALLAGAVSATMLAMTVATSLWWGSLARVAPWFLHGEPAGTRSSPFEPQLFGADALMLLATCLAAFGAARALLAARQLPDAPSAPGASRVQGEPPPAA